MPDNTETNPNYELLLEENQKLSNRIDELTKRLDDVVNFNRSLLSRKAPLESVDNKENAKKKLEAFISKGEK